MPFPFGILAADVSSGPLFSVNFQDTTKFPVVATGGTMSAAAFLAASGITFLHTTEAAGVGLTTEAGSTAITFPTGSSVGTLIQGAVPRFGGKSATSAGWGLRLETLTRKNWVQTNNVANPGGTGAAGWTNAGFGADSAVAAPDGSTNATRTNIAGGQYSSYQQFTAPNSDLHTSYVYSQWVRATTNGTVFQDRFDINNLLPLVRVPALSNVWQKIAIPMDQSIYPVNTANGSSISPVTGLAESGFGATAVDAQWFLPQLEIGTEIPSTSIITPSGATGTANPDRLTVPASSVVNNGALNFTTTFIPDGSMPSQYAGQPDIQLWVHQTQANTWLKIVNAVTAGFTGANATPSYGFGGYLVASVAGNVEMIGFIQWTDQDVVQLATTVGGGQNFEGYYTLNGGSPIYLQASPGNFGGASISNAGTIALFCDGTQGGFRGTVLNLRCD